MAKLRTRNNNTNKYLVVGLDLYLLGTSGCPFVTKKLKNSDLYPVETRCKGKLGCWNGKLLSYGDHFVLINSVLTSLPKFMLSFLEIPKGVRKQLDFYRYRFFGKVMRIKENTDSQNGI